MVAGVHQLRSDQNCLQWQALATQLTLGRNVLPCARLRSLMCLLGMYNLTTAEVEGANDPGGIMTKKANMLAMLSALSLFQKGCDGEFDPDAQPSWAMVFFHSHLWFWQFCWFGGSAVATATNNDNQFEPDAEPDAMLAQQPTSS